MRPLQRSQLNYQGLIDHVRRYKPSLDSIQVDYSTQIVIHEQIEKPYVAIKLYSTEIIKYYDDGSVVLDMGTYGGYSSTRDKINRYSPPGIGVIRDKKKNWIHDADAPRTPTKNWKCKTCFGRNISMLEDDTALVLLALTGKYAAHVWSRETCGTRYDRTQDPVTGQWKYSTIYLDCQLDYEKHLINCYKCDNTGRADYGNKPILNEFYNGVRFINIDGTWTEDQRLFTEV